MKLNRRLIWGKRDAGVATDLPESAQASAHHLASWKFAEPKTWLTPEMLLGEVRDDIDKLNGRPDSTGRCLTAVDIFREQPTEANRTAVREAYEAIPEHRRRYALGDMDRKDFPLRVIVTGQGNQIELWSGNTVDVTEEMHASALEYFAEREQLRKQYETKTPADGPTEPVESSVHLNQAVFPRGWPENPGTLVLRNEFPAPIVMGNRTYPTVAHAYWALAVATNTDRPRSSAQKGRMTRRSWTRRFRTGAGCAAGRGAIRRSRLRSTRRRRGRCCRR
ncbi:hypothetical protein ACFRQM_46190 [Streptomyces sp. NPDC056831]|uniref:DUF7639 domain-containing protein n=1 Tax=Streptomyces sp. NPDC056831 TaxID=3345954 RepID=UPI0036868F79